MNTYRSFTRYLSLAAITACAVFSQTHPAPSIPAAGSKLPPVAAPKTVAETDCTADKLGTSIPVGSIGLPVSAVTLSAPQWHAAANNAPAYCSVDGSMAPVDKSGTAKPILFRVALPATWQYRAAQLGGGGMNGTVPNLLGERGAGGTLLQQGFATYGSDSGHQMGGFGGGFPGGMGARGGMPGRGPGGPPAQAGQAAPGGPPAQAEGARGPANQMMGRGPMGAMPFGQPNPEADAWATDQEAMANLGYMQLKKTHDAAMVLVERMYGQRPRFNYFFGSSQGGREALTVAERFPADYDGIAANVPILGFSTLMLAPELIRIHEKPLANWVTMAKVNAIRGEFMRQCDKLDGLVDGIINNYPACRAIFDMSQGDPQRNPWAAKRCPNNVDPNPSNTSAAACFTDGQISTLEFVYSHYKYATPLANGVKSFGMWTPNTDPSGSGLIAPARYRGQEGAPDNAPLHSHLGILGVTGFLMQNLTANPLDYVEGGPLNKRRVEISAILDSTNPDLTPFYRHGGKLLVAIGSNDTLASPGAQMDYYQSVIAKLGQPTVDAFARLWVLPQTGHGLSGTIYGTDGDGKTVQTAPIPNSFDRVALVMDWVENNKAPGRQVTVTAGERSLPMCSYPEYPKYVSGPVTAASSYTCAAH
ncbi:MAG TPA: tannase/feruloyl esterase family alpha/beta hydrolase [Bryobacteraceae bacterium]|nr:tannase/feruloyl esterase family alpha/beta hydrolase [Bryobacteraceae bacterium]